MINYIVYFATGFNIVLFYFYFEELPQGTSWELIFCWAALLIRVFCISFRYAFTSDKIYSLRKNTILKGVILKREYIISAWRKVDPKMIDIEIMESMTRLNLDSDLFVFSLLNQPTDDWIFRFARTYFHLLKTFNYEESRDRFTHIYDEVLQLLKNLQERSSKENKINRHIAAKFTNYEDYFEGLEQFPDPIESEQNIYYYSDSTLKSINFPTMNLVRELYLNACFRIDHTFNNIINILLIVYILTPYILRYYLLGHFSVEIFGNGGIEIYMLTMNTLTRLFILFANVNFLIVACIDFQRKAYSLDCLTSILTADRTNISWDLKIMPMLNFICHNNIKSWIMARHLVFDIGKRYLSRAEGYVSAFIVVYFAITITLLLGLLGIAHSVKFSNAPNFFIYAYFETFIMLSIIMQIVYYGIKINNSFIEHKNLIYKIKSSMYHMLKNEEIFDENKNFTNKYLDYGKNIYQSMDKNEFKETINNAHDAYDIAIEQIDVDEQTHAICLLGIELRKEIITQFYVLVLTLSYGLIYNYVAEISDVI